MSSKRKRLSENIGFEDSRNKHKIFTDWAKDRGVQINGVVATQMEGRGVGLVTTKPLKTGERILHIPVKAMFKPDIALLKREKLDRISPQAQLAISAMMAFNASSAPFKVWEDTWPTESDLKEGLPMCWARVHTEDLPPSTLQPLERQRSDYQKDWRDVREFCFSNDYAERDFMFYWMIVNSRSFGWKPRGARSGEMVMCPFIDYLNHGPTGSTCRVTQNPDGYAVHADRNYTPGEEVLATYGAHSNDQLLVHYGFILSDGPSGPSIDDSIRLDSLIIPELSDDLQVQLQDLGYLGGYALLPASNEICFKTQVALRAKTLTCNEWEYFAANGEDLGEDQTESIHELVKEIFGPYLRESLERKKATEPNMAYLRLMQILRAMQKFIANSLPNGAGAS